MVGEEVEAVELDFITAYGMKEAVATDLFDLIDRKEQESPLQGTTSAVTGRTSDDLAGFAHNDTRFRRAIKTRN